MTIATLDLDLIKKEVASIREYYQSRMESEIPPLKEEVDRVAAQLNHVHEMWREGEKQAILSKYWGGDRSRVPYGKYTGSDHLDMACVRSLLNAQLRELASLNPCMLEDWQTNIKAAMDSTTSGSGDELVDTQEARVLWDDVNLETAVAPLFNTIQMPSNPFQIPLQLGDVNWYPGTENVATKSTAVATARQTLTAYELRGRSPVVLLPG